MGQQTRWNSTYLMIVRLLELQEFCENKADLLKGLHITARQWVQLEEISNILKPVAQLTTRLQSEQLDVTQFVSHWKMAMFALDRQDSQGNAGKLRQLIKVREVKVFDNLVVKAAIYLDKRFSFSLLPEENNEAKAFINQVWRKRKFLAGVTEEDHDQLIEEPIMSDKENTSDEMSQFADHMAALARSESQSQGRAHKENLSDLVIELTEYEKLSRLSPAESIMEFWKNQEMLPILKEIATDILSIPVTEVSVERMFSHLTFILNRYRSSLKADLLEDIMFLRLNKKFVGNL